MGVVVIVFVIVAGVMGVVVGVMGVIVVVGAGIIVVGAVVDDVVVVVSVFTSVFDCIFVFIKNGYRSPGSIKKKLTVKSEFDSKYWFLVGTYFKKS